MPLPAGYTLDSPAPAPTPAPAPDLSRFIKSPVLVAGQPVQPAAATATTSPTATTPPAPAPKLPTGYTLDPQPAAAAAPAPGLRDRIINYLLRPMEHDATPTPESAGLDSSRMSPEEFTAFMAAHNEAPVLYAGRRTLGHVAEMVLHPWDAAVGMAKSMVEPAMMPPPVPGVDFNKYMASLQHDADTGNLGWLGRAQLAAMKDQIAQGEQLKQDFKKDPVDAIAELVAPILVTHGLAKTLGAAKAMVVRPQAGSPLLVDTEALPGGEPPPPGGGGAAAQPNPAVPAPAAEPAAGAPTGRKLVAARRVLNISPADTARDVRELGSQNLAAQQAAEDAYQQALAKHTDDVARIRDSNAAAAEEHEQVLADLRDKVEADYKQATEQHAAEQAAAEAARQTTGEQASAASAAEQDLAERQDANRREELSLRDRLWRRLQTMQASAKGTVDSLYNTVRSKVGPDRTTPIAPLLEAVEQATDPQTGMLAGSQPKISIFQDILRRARGAADDEVVSKARADVMAGQGYRGSYDELSPVHKALVDRVVSEDLAGRQDALEEAAAAGQPDAPHDLSFDHLRGYSSELGRAIYNERDGDVRRALSHVKDTVDAMAQQMATDAGAGKSLQKANNANYVYRRVFLEPTTRRSGAGIPQPGSPIAKALQAPQSFHATEGLLTDNPAEVGFIRRLLVGGESLPEFKGRATPYKDIGAGKLYDRFRQVMQEQQDLADEARQAAAATRAAGKSAGKAASAAASEAPLSPTEQATALSSKYGREVRYNPAAIQYEFVDSGRALPEQPGLPRVPSLRQAPEPAAPERTQPRQTAMTVDRLTQLRRDSILRTLDQWRQISKNDVYLMGGGAVSLIAGLANLVRKMNPLSASLELATGSAMLSRSLAPKFLAGLLDKPAIIEKLARPTLADLREVMALPADQRPGVEAAVRALSDEAQRRGKLRRPSPLLTALAAGANVAQQQQTQAASATAQQEQQRLEEIQKGLQQSLSDLQEQQQQQPQPEAQP